MNAETPEHNGSHSTEVSGNGNLSAQEKGINGEGQGPTAQALPDPETIERLGRQRPPHFSNIWTELAFCFSIFMCQILSVCLPYSGSLQECSC